MNQDELLKLVIPAVIFSSVAEDRYEKSLA